ncbi:MAG: lamin tail domain-containing protein, partial [Myxococcota bacterium]|nr:lamin tail domain-containing protein [Myxococcota bacterium]
TEYGYTERTAKDVFQQVRKNTVDVLMVVDNSCSMFEEQDNLAANFSGFISAFEGVDVDWQIGVTTTDAADAAPSGHLLGGDDEIELLDPEGRTIDRVAFDMSWNVPVGASFQLDPGSFTVAGNDDMANWCPGTAAYGDGDLGTPGGANAACGSSGPAPAATAFASSDTGAASDDTGNDDTGANEEVPASGRPGDVIITEFMADPTAVADAMGEWVEVTSTVDAALDLSGWQLVDSGRNRFTLPAASILPARGRMVLGRSTDAAANGGAVVDIAVGDDFTLNNRVLVLTSDTEGAGEIFSEMVAVGITGSGIEMGLDAARLALSEPLLSGHNAGLVREDANLSLIFVSDENDYSRDPVNDYYRHFADLKGADAYRDHGVLNFSAVVGMDV